MGQDDSEYQNTLSEETLEIAKSELREDDAIRADSLRMMKEWALKNPCILRCRTDPNFLLRFLRTKKFSVPLAQEAFLRYLLLRQTFPAFKNMDMNNPATAELLQKGYIFVSPRRDTYGRRVIIYRPGVFDPHRHTQQDMVRMHGLCYEALMEDEENQIRGFTHFADGRGVSMPFLTIFTPKEAARLVKNGERTLPMRHKQVIGFHAHPSLNFLIEWGMTLVSDKIRKRVQIVNSPEEALKHIDKSCLPKEYGGDIPMDDMIKSWIEELKGLNDIIISHDKMEVQLALFSEQARAGAVSSLKHGLFSANCSNTPIVGSFRKLEVD